MEDVIWVKTKAEYFQLGYWTKRWCNRPDGIAGIGRLAGRANRTDTLTSNPNIASLQRGGQSGGRGGSAEPSDQNLTLDTRGDAFARAQLGLSEVAHRPMMRASRT
jgi:hypothetical protein